MQILTFTIHLNRRKIKVATYSLPLKKTVEYLLHFLDALIQKYGTTCTEDKIKRRKTRTNR